MRVRLAGISKAYGDVTAVRDVSVDIPSGHLCTFLGPSGCGKTTCLNMVAGFLRPDTGDVVVGDRTVTDLAPHRRNTGMVFQGYALFPHLTVAQNVAFGPKLRRTPRSEIAARTRELLDLVELSGLENRYPRELSGGQQQRVALARALIISPDVLLLDEPLSNLDAKLREQMRDEVRRIQRSLGITTIFVTHDQEEAMAVSDQIVVMNRGRIEQAGPPEDIYLRPRTAFVATFMGAANLLPLAKVSRTADAVEAVLRDDGAVIALPAAAPVPDGAAFLVVRPEHLGIAAGSATIRAVFRGAVFLGSSLVAEFELGPTRLRARLDPAEGRRLVPGEVVPLAMRTDRTVLVP